MQYYIFSVLIIYYSYDRLPRTTSHMLVFYMHKSTGYIQCGDKMADSITHFQYTFTAINRHILYHACPLEVIQDFDPSCRIQPLNTRPRDRNTCIGI